MTKLKVEVSKWLLFANLAANFWGFYTPFDYSVKHGGKNKNADAFKAFRMGIRKVEF
jgi:hypothetical protein